MANLSVESISRHLRRLVKGDVEFDIVSRRLYATDAGLTQIEPLGVVSPRDAEDVVRLVAYAAEMNLPLIPRGMGSGLNGGAVGAGIQVDFSRYMHQVLEVAPDASWVRVQPGIVLAALNRRLHPLGVFFPPDPSSENHCSLGGMIGTNASGAHTVSYGATKDHVLALDAVMADSRFYNARPLTPESSEMQAFLSAGSLAGGAFATVLHELSRRGEEIRSRLPRVAKNSCGYRIDALLEDDPASKGRVPLQKLLVGAEGTLGLVTEATLNLAPLPAKRGVAMAYFPSVYAAGEVVPGILALAPAAVEIMDSRFLALVRQYDCRVDSMLPERTDTALLIEFEGGDEQELAGKFEALRQHLNGGDIIRFARAASQAETDHLWQMRKSAVALMQRRPGARQPLPFIEDITVHPTKLPGCIAFLQDVLDREGVQAVTVGHVGDGNLHTRPVLDPKNPADQLTMQRIFDEVSAYVLSVGGTFSGEHGDGIVHTPRLSTMYGPEVYSLFELIKRAFDPQGIFNPGKKVDHQEPGRLLTTNTRYKPGYLTLPQSPTLHFSAREYEGEIERCHGCGSCKGELNTTMCPVYKATRREHASPRAKANLLRGVIAGALDSGRRRHARAIKAVTDYCIECGMCAVECPSRVNIPKLVLEAKTRYWERHPRRPADTLLGHAEQIWRWASLLAPISNRVANQRLLRRLTQPLFGLDRRRILPAFSGTSSRCLVPPKEAARSVCATKPTVVYFWDLFARYNDPGLASTVERVLKAHGVQVALPDQRASGFTEMLYGYAARARSIAAFNVGSVLPYVREGAKVVSAEPTATFAFKVRYPEYLGSSDALLVAEAARDLSEYLALIRLESPEASPATSPIDAGSWCLESGHRLRIAYHQPCHLKAQQIGNPGLRLLEEIPGAEVIDLAAGCCGMAGTFGMKARTYDLSLAIGRPLLERIAEVEPDLLASECSTCRMQLQQSTGIEAVHPVVLLAGSYRA